MGKSLSNKYGQKRLYSAKKSISDAIKGASKRAIQKQQKQLVIWLVIKLLIKSRNFEKTSQENDSDAVANEND